MSAMLQDCCLVQFAKAPVPGQVKTRLGAVLSEQHCADLHRALVEHVFWRQWRGRVAHQELWYSSPHPFFDELAEQTGVTLRHQGNGDLGERMSFAFCDRLASYTRVVLIGSDCPALDASYIRSAFEVLNDVPVVLGPASDGGYVLLGLRTYLPTLFTEMPWGTERVLNETRLRLRGIGYSWRELSELPDIDRPEDLSQLHSYETLNFFAVNI
jgi:rSAM/selenodomain-associated transferase 1